MAGLKKFFPEFTFAGAQVSQSDIDQYDLVALQNPSVAANWYGTAKGTGTAGTVAIGITNILADWPRNIYYSITGIAAGLGGTFTSSLVDQFGNTVSESVGFATTASGGSVYGTVIAARYISGSLVFATNNATTVATVAVGLGTNTGTAGNYFGLLSKIAGTSDVKNITWINSTTATAMGGGSALGSLVSTTMHAFQGTNNLLTTDGYRVIFKPTFDNSAYGTMCNL
jgi:hypothetical protein